jgi:hypothetical protein
MGRDAGTGTDWEESRHISAWARFSLRISKDPKTVSPTEPVFTTSSVNDNLNCMSNDSLSKPQPVAMIA